MMARMDGVGAVIPTTAARIAASGVWDPCLGSPLNQGFPVIYNGPRSTFHGTSFVLCVTRSSTLQRRLVMALPTRVNRGQTDPFEHVQREFDGLMNRFMGSRE